MLKSISLAAALGLTVTALVSGPSAAEPREVLPNITALGAPREMPTRVLNQAGPTKSGGSNLSYHNGPVMSQPVVVTPIYWGGSWDTSKNNTFTGDKVTGMADLYNGYGASSYANISTQYGQSSGAKVTNAVSHGTALYDFSAASSDQATIAAEVVAKVGFNNIDVNGFYPVYTDLPRGSAGYCAWHSASSVSSNGVTKVFKYAFFFSLAGDAGCTASSGSVSYSTVTQSLANVSAHELAEAMTDPQLNAWYDSRGYENADKCAWKFSGVQTLSNGKQFQLQGEWNNLTGGCSWS